MKNQYVGDVNDYVKYAFLRRLIQDAGALAVCWMLTADDGRSDGNRRSYLDAPTRYRRHDPELFDALAGELRGASDIKRIEESGLLPRTRFFSDPLADDRESRDVYFSGLQMTLAPNSLVFFDPDNGLDVATVQRGRRNSSKYLYRDELGAVLKAGHSAVVYQHFPRVPREAFIRRALQSVLSPPKSLRRVAVYTPHVTYLLFLQPRHEDAIASAQTFANSWDPMVRFISNGQPPG
jgi:hypothetical protein